MPPSGDPYLDALLGWLHRLLFWHVGVTKQTYGELADDEYRGLYVPDAEIEQIRDGAAPLPDDLVAYRVDLETERQEIERLGQMAALEGAESPLLRLGRLFGLTRFERDVLVLTLAPELDLRCERLYAYIQDDVTRKRPTVDLALRLLEPSVPDRLERRMSFGPDAPLMRHRLIEIFDEGQRQAVLLARFLKLDDAIVAELLGQPVLDSRLDGIATLHRPELTLDRLVLPPELIGLLRQARASVGAADGLALLLQGTYGQGRRSVAEALAAEHGVPLLAIDVERLIAGDLRPDDAMRRIERQGRIRSAALYWRGIDRLAQGGEADPWLPSVLGAIDTYPGICVLPTEQRWDARHALRQTRFVRVVLPMPSFSERERIWRSQLGETMLDDGAVAAIASTFRLSPGQIRDAAVMAQSLAALEGEPLQAAHLTAACQSQSTGRLDALARKITPTYGWDDIVLPADHMAQLREICSQMRHRRTVLETWGFDQHHAMGKGLCTLFAGPSGTGKTMAADIIATDLGLELYKVDLSTLVSKYIGETEKNLDRIFTAAQEANAILFFDEADAIFGKRSEVKDAHDRYANIEVGYLLQKMEEYDGVVVLATNLRKNIDDAFVRRLHMSIDFPFPDEEDRLRIWRKVFPRSAPLAVGVDLRFLARQFKVTGGNIRNIALLSAYLAADEGGPIDMPHIVRALKREYQKLGKLVTETDFGAYLALVRA